MATLILGVLALAAVASAVLAVPGVVAAGPAAQGAEVWRMIGYLMFAGVFAVLARDGRRQRALWGITIAAKAALPVAALTFARGAHDASAFLVVDGLVAALLVVAFLLQRRRPAPHPEVPTP